MNHNTILSFIKLNIFIVPMFLVISYFIVPVFSQPSLCLDLFASEPHDSILPTLPCVKLTTIPQHLYPIYVTKNKIIYQQNAFYSYDLSMKYGSPILNILFTYTVSCGIAFCFYWIIRSRRKQRE